MQVVSGTYCYKYLHVTCVWAQFVSVCGGYEGRIWGRSPVEVTRAHLGSLLVALCVLHQPFTRPRPVCPLTCLCVRSGLCTGLGLRARLSGNLRAEL